MSFDHKRPDWRTLMVPHIDGRSGPSALLHSWCFTAEVLSHMRILAILGVILGFFQKWAWGLTQGFTLQSRICYLHPCEWRGNLNNLSRVNTGSLSQTAQRERCILTFDQQTTLPSLWFCTDDNALGNRVHSCRWDRGVKNLISESYRKSLVKTFPSVNDLSIHLHKMGRRKQSCFIHCFEIHR